MNFFSLRSAVKDILGQGLLLLDRVNDETYARPNQGVYSASIGAHYRHVLDHFLCLSNSIRTRVVNYDHRERNPELENSSSYARFVTEQLMEEFSALEEAAFRASCSVTYSVGYDGDEPSEVPSNLARELMFCVGHAIHHFAILKLLCAAVAIPLPYEFGIAPSTLKHNEAQSAH